MPNWAEVENVLRTGLRNGDIARTILQQLQNVSGISITLDRFGLNPDDTVSTSVPFQAAFDYLAANGGGELVLDASRRHGISTEITIKSRFPIKVRAAMSGSGAGGTVSGVTAGSARAVIYPMAGLTGSMFSWDFVAGETDFADTGGGGMDGLRFVDWDGDSFRNVAFTAAVRLIAAGYFLIDDCVFTGLKSSAVKIDQCVVCTLDRTKINFCGDTDHPAVDVGDGVLFSGLYSDGSFIEANHTEAYVRCRDESYAVLTNPYFEGLAGNASMSHPFVTGSAIIRGGFANANDGTKFALTGEKNMIDGMYISGGPSTNVPTITMTGVGSVIQNCPQINAGSPQVGNCVLMSGASSSFINNKLENSGNVALSGANAQVAFNRIDGCYTTQTAIIKVTSTGSQVIGNRITVNNGTGVKGIEVTGNDFVVLGNVVSGLVSVTNDIDTSSASAGVVLGNVVENAISTHLATSRGYSHDGFKQFVGVTFDPGSVLAGATATSSDFTVSGAVLGDIVDFASSVSLQGMMVTAYVASNGNVRVNLFNPTGSTIDLTSSTWYFRVRH